MDVFIGTRMHSNIFAMTQNVPVIPIGYLHKTNGIARSVGIEDWVIDINDINAELLINKFDELWKMRHQVRQQLENRIPVLIEQINEVGPAIAQDFRDWNDR
jgi:colanic acid/amylovoran biosynthesis protein